MRNITIAPFHARDKQSSAGTEPVFAEETAPALAAVAGPLRVLAPTVLAVTAQYPSPTGISWSSGVESVFAQSAPAGIPKACAVKGNSSPPGKCLNN